VVITKHISGLRNLFIILHGKYYYAIFLKDAGLTVTRVGRCIFF